MTEEAAHSYRDRAGDNGFWCVVALRCSQAWDFIDKRDIDKHATAVIIITAYMVGTYHVVMWGARFAERWIFGAEAMASAAPKVISGTEVAMVIGAVLGPWTLLGSVVISTIVNFYFKSRPG